MAITVQGVVLGLVFALVDKTNNRVFIDVGVIALAVGVIVGVLLYTVTAIDVSGDWPVTIAALLLNLTLWALAYGLLSIVAGVISGNVVVATS